MPTAAILLLLALAAPDARPMPPQDEALARAEAHFLADRMNEALAAYREIERWPTSGPFGYSVYKQAWCQMNLGRHEEALGTFERVVDLVTRGKIKPWNAADLARAAGKDLARAYARARPPEHAAAYFARVTPVDLDARLEQLADLYREQGDARSSTATLRELMARSPSSPRLCVWQLGALRAAMSAGAKGEQLAELQRLGAVLARVPALPAAPQVVSECRKALHDTSRELAVLWHKEGQRTKDVGTLGMAEPVYREQLLRLGQESGSYDLAFYHAELLRKLERWQEAAEAYDAVVARDPTGKRLEEAAYAAVLAWKNAAGLSNVPAPPAGGAQLRRQPLSPVLQKVVAALDRYVRHVPDGPKSAAMRFRKARMHYDHNLFAEAVPLFLEVMDAHPDHELAIYAANLYLDSLNAMGPFAEVCVAARRLAAGPLPARDPEFARVLKRVLGDCDRSKARR